MSRTLKITAKKDVRNQSIANNEDFFFTAIAEAVSAPPLFTIRSDAAKSVPIVAKASR